MHNFLLIWRNNLLINREGFYQVFTTEINSQPFRITQSLFDLLLGTINILIYKQMFFELRTSLYKKEYDSRGLSYAALDLGGNFNVAYRMIITWNLKRSFDSLINFHIQATINSELSFRSLFRISFDD